MRSSKEKYYTRINSLLVQLKTNVELFNDALEGLAGDEQDDIFKRRMEIHLKLRQIELDKKQVEEHKESIQEIVIQPDAIEEKVSIDLIQTKQDVTTHLDLSFSKDVAISNESFQQENTELHEKQVNDNIQEITPELLQKQYPSNLNQEENTFLTNLYSASSSVINVEEGDIVIGLEDKQIIDNPIGPSGDEFINIEGVDWEKIEYISDIEKENDSETKVIISESERDSILEMLFKK